MKRTPLRRRSAAHKSLKRRTPLHRSPSLAASEAQRVAVAGRACIVCATTTGRIDPAHLIPRSLDGWAMRSASSRFGVELSHLLLHAGLSRRSPSIKTAVKAP